ncbi:MAG: thymidine phosphorylase, partial [Ruminococcus flavefaciens]|nr:thymidine phosphorylase [Ruminococcus flavefaciens]
EGIKVDKHSTGGVGDKTTLAVGPIVAACGGKVAKMSGRGLGFTGGTIDKLESIPDMKTDLDQEKFFHNVNQIGISLIGQSGEITPADKKLYALRDVTATVDSIPLIAASIMSKKLAAGSDKIVLDVTVGSGAFMKKIDDAILLAKKMVAIGEGAGRETVAYLTDMDQPLGVAVGNTIEVEEAIETLKGNGAADFEEICITFAATMLSLAGIGTIDECRKKAGESIENGSALQKFAEMVKLQGGNPDYILKPNQFEKAKYSCDFVAEQEGYISAMDTEKCGRVSVILGAGREVKGQQIDNTAGIYFYKKIGDYVKKGEVIAKLCTSVQEKLSSAQSLLAEVYQYRETPVKKKQVILAYITKEGISKIS